MALRDVSPHAEPHAQINVLPLIDVLLVLVVIFMILSIRPPIQRLQLPQPAMGPDQGRASRIVLELDSAGHHLLNRRPVARESLETVLHQVFDGRVERIMHVTAAPNRTYQEVITAADVARGAGVQVIGLLAAATTSATAR